MGVCSFKNKKINRKSSSKAQTAHEKLLFNQPNSNVL